MREGRREGVHVHCTYSRDIPEILASESFLSPRNGLLFSKLRNG